MLLIILMWTLKVVGATAPKCVYVRKIHYRSATTLTVTSRPWIKNINPAKITQSAVEYTIVRFYDWSWLLSAALNGPAVSVNSCFESQRQKNNNNGLLLSPLSWKCCGQFFTDGFIVHLTIGFPCHGYQILWVTVQICPNTTTPKPKICHAYS